MQIPSLNLETYLISKGYFVIGVDEVGRGAFAGPVVAGAVLLKKPQYISGVRDSKLLSAKQREKLAHKIRRNFMQGIGQVDAVVIDKIGIRQATFYAMQKAINEVISTLIHELFEYQLQDFNGSEYIQLVGDLVNKIVILVDGKKSVVKLPYKNVFYFEKGDQVHASISYASIIAKVYRDSLMEKLGKKYSVYAWDKNKGYGTYEHRNAILTHGQCSYHRRTFTAKLLHNGKKPVT